MFSDFFNLMVQRVYRTQYIIQSVTLIHHRNPTCYKSYIFCSLVFVLQLSKAEVFPLTENSLMRTLVADESDIYLDVTVTHCTNNGRDSRSGEPIPTVRSFILDDYTPHPTYTGFQENCTSVGPWKSATIWCSDLQKPQTPNEYNILFLKQCHV